MYLFGAVQSPMVLLAIPLASVVVWSISGPMAAYSVSRDNDITFPAVNRFVVQPMFLFSGTFFPVEQFPSWIAWIARATPLWHGVQLFRSLSLGTAELGPSLGHIAYLLAWFAVGMVLCVRAYPRPLQA
jgi:lipooligosaccharide transport system permease protein